MEIQEFFRTEGFIDDFKCFDGRWQCEFNSDERIYGKGYFEPQLTWTDMFGKEEDKIIFKFQEPDKTDEISYVIPLTTRFAIMLCREIEEGEPNEFEEPRSWWIIELDWITKKCKLGTKTFTCELMKYIHVDGHIWVDQSDLNDGDLHFIVRKKEEGNFICKYCKIDAEQLQYEQIGSIFELPANLFNTVNFNGKIISGISTSVDIISYYDLNTRQILSSSSQRAHGLPPSICLNVKDSPAFDYTSKVGAWTLTHLYLWSEEKHEDEEDKYSSYIYEIEIKTRALKKLSHKFDGQIRQMFISHDGHLLIHVQKFLRKENFKGPAWSLMMYGRQPFFEFKMYCLKLLHKHEPSLDDKIFSHSWQTTDTKYIQNKNKVIETKFE